MQAVQIKVYGNFSPVQKPVFSCLDSLRQEAYGAADEWLVLEQDSLSISFEGLFFPVEAALRCLEENLSTNAIGRLDVLALDEWQMTRYVWQQGHFLSSSRSLNHVLAYSGF